MSSVATVHPFSWSYNPDALLLVPAMLGAYGVASRWFPVDRARAACFAAGSFLLLAVFVSPLDTLARHYLLSAHLLQNVVVAEWAPALLVVGLPTALAVEAGRLPAVRGLTHPLVALPLWLCTYFAWHLPWAYDTALRHPNTLLHAEHACYFVAGAALWWPVVHGRRSGGVKASYLFAAFVLASPLGLLLALLPSAVYGFYESAPRIWGLSPLADQQIAGVTMAAEQAIVFFGVFAYYFMRFVSEDEAREVFRSSRA